MPCHTLNFHSVGCATNLSRPELSNELEVFCVIDVHLSSLIVLKLRMVHQFLWQFLSTETPNALNLKVRHFIQDAHSRKRMFPEEIKPMQETTQQVLSLVQDCSFFAVLVVMEEPELVAFWVKLLF